MQVSDCTYLGHENEEIIEFCLNKNCRNSTQYCSQCLTKISLRSQNDCARFVTISQSIDEFIQIQNESTNQLIYFETQNSIEQISKRMDQEIQILEKMSQKTIQKQKLFIFSVSTQVQQNPIIMKKKKNILENQQYNIVKCIKSNDLNNFLDTIENFLTDQIKRNIQRMIACQNEKTFQEFNQQSKEQNQQFIQKSKELFTEGKTLLSQSLKRFEDQMDLYNQDEEVHLYKGVAQLILIKK